MVYHPRGYTEEALLGLCKERVELQLTIGQPYTHHPCNPHWLEIDKIVSRSPHSLPLLEGA
ncbi:hypothetical protein H6P81_018002 [Aristolochia fimbriata]|uniref:Uncharacterized protein n=1 Tax=Aristolochia fimbriata TaxID=158543 RepID=A0AAV7E081_ARIFI|nr:hypothetical protein H6P81_018002 [Aristolochia fimbriata]